MKTNHVRTVLAGMLATALGLVGGCGDMVGDRPVAGESFRPEGEVRAANQFARVQAASGARADSTLRVAHFDKGDLNSLGQEKLDLIVSDDDACSPLVVRIEVADDAMSDARRDAVRVYLKDRGLADEQVKLEAGPNSKYTFAAKDAIAGKKTLSAGGAIGTNPEPATGGASADAK